MVSFRHNLHRGQWVCRALEYQFTDFLSFKGSTQKGGFLSVASSQGIALVFPDTSPRGAGIEGEDTEWDFGVAAGFYLDATNPKYAKHYNMRTLVTTEFPRVLEAAGLPLVRSSSLSFDPIESVVFAKGFQTPVNFWTQYGRPWCSHTVPFI